MYICIYDESGMISTIFSMFSFFNLTNKDRDICGNYGDCSFHSYGSHGPQLEMG